MDCHHTGSHSCAHHRHRYRAMAAYPLGDDIDSCQSSPLSLATANHKLSAHGSRAGGSMRK